MAGVFVITWFEDKVYTAEKNTRPVYVISAQVAHFQSAAEADFTEQLKTCLNTGCKELCSSS